MERHSTTTRKRTRTATPTGETAAAPSTQRAEPSISELLTLQWRSERSDLDLDNFLLGLYLMRIGVCLDRAFDRVCLEHWGIGSGDMRVMLALRRGGAPYVKRPTDLFRALLVTSGAITKKVDRLEKAGFVERLSDPGHSGGFLVHLTKKGLRAADGATAKLANESALAPATSAMTKEELASFGSHVLRVISSLERAEDDAR